MKFIFSMMLCAVFEVRQLPQSESPLEPSIQNEVDHALDRATSWLGHQACTNAVPAYDLFKTNGLTREQIALRLVSQQRSGGWWLTETNAAPTKLAVEILKGL